MSKRPLLFGLLAVLVPVVALVGCNSESATTPEGDPEGRLSLLLTGSAALGTASLDLGLVAGAEELQHSEEPLQRSQVERAEIWVSDIHLVGGGGEPVFLFRASGADDLLHLDLMDLREGMEIELLEPIPVPEGSYGQLRVTVAEARVQLASGFAFADGSTEAPATIPSGFLRVNLNDDLSIEGGQGTLLLLDFALERSFVFQGPPWAPRGVLIRPVLFHESARHQQGR